MSSDQFIAFVTYYSYRVLLSPTFYLSYRLACAVCSSNYLNVNTMNLSLIIGIFDTHLHSVGIKLRHSVLEKAALL